MHLIQLISKQITSCFFTSYNAELMERAALFEWLHVHWLFQDFFALSTIKLHCMGDLAKYWADPIDRVAGLCNTRKSTCY